jgi:DNA-binding transcriptional ArsR family regulator
VEPGDDVLELTDPRAIRAIAHPARLAVIDALYEQGRELTATQAAALANISPSAMSYHLRSLERFGIVQRAPASEDGRERPWQRAGRNLRIRPSTVTSSKAAAVAAGAVLATAMDFARERMLAALDRRSEPDGEHPLDKAAGYAHTTVLVTPEEAADLLVRLTELIEPYRVESRKRVPEDAWRMMFLIASIPDLDNPSAVAAAKRAR